VLAQHRERLAREALVAQTKIADIAQARLRAGDTSELESSTARVAALRAREDSRDATHQLVLSRQRLGVLLGSTAHQQELRAVATDLRGTSVPDGKRLMDEAIASRPDMRASELELEAAGKRVGLTTAELFALSAILDANEKDSGGGFELGPGVELPIPILHQNQGARARARAELERSAWRLAAMRQQIQGDVTVARAQLLQTREALQSWRGEVLPPLNEAVEQTTRAYEAGEVSLLAVHEATRERVSGRMREAELIAAVQRAQAELARAIGRQLDP
jgi:outer membrane protein, heavy metal efflux system